MKPDEAGSESMILKLGPLEEQIMNLLWDSQTVSIREVMDTLPQSPAYTTVATVMQNLQRKGLVDPQKRGRAVRYVPLISREEHSAALMRHALESSSDRAASILHFVQDISDEERALLQAYLSQVPYTAPEGG